MPKLSKRQRQLRDIVSQRGRRDGEEGEEGYDDQDEEDDESSEEEAKAVEAPVPPKKSLRGFASRPHNRGGEPKAAPVVAVQGKGKEKNKEKSMEKAGEDERIWVQCNTCDKWRALPSTVDVDKLPDIWTCSLNHYDSARRSCRAPEEVYKLPEEEQHLPLKDFLKVWSKKLKCGDRAENRLSSAALTRGKKRKVDGEWVQCGNPSCGKWRAVPKAIEVAAMLRRLNKGKFYGGEGKWFCSMNSWDETTASCSAPQEPLWNCRWNLHGR
mmetsp:Transcript_14150/g.31764  ORF Transcript_14150/g.31764 Transcript_14150/m.31764 type:complete len:269 (+) Transcript_14150:86-892(+)